MCKTNWLSNCPNKENVLLCDIEISNKKYLSSKYLSSKIFNNIFEIVTIVNNIFKKISSNRINFLAKYSYNICLKHSAQSQFVVTCYRLEKEQIDQVLNIAVP